MHCRSTQGRRASCAHGQLCCKREESGQAAEAARVAGESGVTTRRNNAGWLIVILALLAPLLLFAMPRQLPALERVRPRRHAVERHGEDALQARAALKNCGDRLRARLCPPSSRHGLSVCFWCESGGPLCPGVYATIGGVEKTALTRPCEQWRECR